MQRRVAPAERELRRDAVDPGHVAVGDDLDRHRPRDELLEQIDCPGPDVDPGGGEHDPVGIVGASVGDVLVEREPLAVERVERVLLDRQRAAALRARALPRDSRRRPR